MPTLTRLRAHAKIFALALLLVLLAGPGPVRAGELARLLCETDSLYHHILVVEEASGLRYLSFNRAMGHQSAVLPNHPEVLTFAYSRSAFAALAFLERPPQEVLFVGLGGGSMPMYLRLMYPQARVDIAEIDPEVARVAEKYLSFRPDQHMKVMVEDGRQFLKRHPQRYDLIFLDAYNDQSVPFHLTTREFLELVQAHLNPGGVVASNIWSQNLNRYFTAQIKTFQQVFPQLYLLQAGGSANYIFLATQSREPLEAPQAVARARQLMQGQLWSFDLAALVGSEYQCYSQRQVQAEVLTDDFAPVNLLKTMDAPQP